MTDTTESSRPRSRRQIWVLIGVFFAPLLLAFLLYYGVSGWRPVGNTNHGELIQPPRPLPEVELATPSGAKLASDALRGKWTLVYIGDGACDARCREALTLIRQTRLALNDDMSRVQRLFLATANCCDQQYLDEQHAGLISAKADELGGQQILDVFSQAVAQPSAAVGAATTDVSTGPASPDLAGMGRIYIVDPLGNLMMYYSPEMLAGTASRGLLDDMKKLLKLSHIG